MALDKNIAAKKSGDPIVSADWNTLATETIRLDSAKLDVNAGGTVAGLLTAAAGLNAASVHSETLGVNLFTPQLDKWDFTTDLAAGVDVITGNLTLSAPTSLIVIGHGHGSTAAGTQAAKRALALEIRMDLRVLNPVRESTWGICYLSPPTGSWFPLIAVGTVKAPPGEHRLDLVLRATDSPNSGPEKYSVNLNGPSLWVARLGTF
jgi:hypothetical protein